MKYTNHQNLPKAFCRAVERQRYDNKGTLSATTLIAPPLMKKLEREHWDEIEVDVADQVFMIHGSSVHYILELAADDGDIVEKRFFADIRNKHISAQVDLLTSDKVLSDWKSTSVWTVIDAKKNGKKEWEAQLNIQAWLIIQDARKNGNGAAVNRLFICALCRDWRESENKRNDDYPKKVEVIEFPLWDHDKAIKYIEERVKLHTMDDPPVCTDEERWARPAKFAVMKKGRKSALRLLDSYGEASNWCVDNDVASWNVRTISGGLALVPKSGISIECRPATYPRCDSYCNVRKFCPVYKA